MDNTPKRLESLDALRSGDVTLVLGEGVATPSGTALPIYAGSGSAGNVYGKVTIIADGIDLTANNIYGKANNTTGTIGSLKLVLNKGELADVAENFVTKDGTEIVLGCDQTKAATLNYSCNLDLNGCDATITVAEGKTLTARDTTVGEPGVLSATGTVVAAEGYVEKTVEGGKSYPREKLQLSAVVLRPAATGFYYKGTFRLTEQEQAQVASYGVVLSLNADPKLDKEDCIWSELTTWAADGSGYGTVLTGIMTKDGGYSRNKANAEKKVYGVSYIKYKDGTVEYSDSGCYTLKQLTEASDTIWDTLTDIQKQGLLDMYNDVPNVMKFWNIPNIKENA